MRLENLDGRETSSGPLRLGEVKQGRFPEERDSVVLLGDEPAIRLKAFAGRSAAGVPPWIEAAVAREDERLLNELVSALADLLPPGGRLMVLYGDDETERGLKRGFPPAVTPLGYALLAAGCTWFKDWYYPEGWKEGELKLQGNKPLSEEGRSANLAELHAKVGEWLERADGDDDELARARERARGLLQRPQGVESELDHGERVQHRQRLAGRRPL